MPYTNSGKIELIVGAKEVPKPAAPKGLADRMSYVSIFLFQQLPHPNRGCSQPKNAAGKEKAKPKTNGASTTANGSSKKKGRPAKKARNSRPKKKTAEELDAEMADYFGPGEGGATNGAVQQPTADAMVDEVL
jgi:THO complex subunit 4